MNEAIDYSTVKWVKQELDATLKQARQALEAYVETPADDTQLRFCAVHLHQVHGTLQMVELYGAALLTEEMEHVVEALIADMVGQRQEAYELVMRGILQLPDYLERLIAGHRDIPLVLLPLLNDLRAIRGKKLLSENSLFMPDLDAALPDELQAPTAADAQAVARKQRHSYQLALLGWFRGKDAEKNLDRIGHVLAELRLASATAPMRRLWWAAEGMVVALRNAWLEPSMATKLLLGQTDRQIKRLIDEGELALAEDAPRDLNKNLLFYIARAHDGGEPVAQIKKTYRLRDLLPDQSELEQAEVSLSGHNADLMATVSAAIKEDLTRIKDAVDIFQRGGGKAPAALRPAADMLRQVADTLGMLGLGALRNTAQCQADATADMAESRRDVDENALMGVAAALIAIESSLDALAGGKVAPPAMVSEDSRQSLPDAEFNQVKTVLAEEAIRDIAQAKDAILAFFESGSDFSLLDKVPQLFHRIGGGLLLLSEQRAAAIVDALRSYVSERLLADRSLPDQMAFNGLADAVSSVEYYFEGLREGRLFGHSILEAAERSLDQLGCEPTPAAALESAGGAEIPSLDMGDVSQAQTSGHAVDDPQDDFIAVEDWTHAEPDADADALMEGNDSIELADLSVEPPPFSPSTMEVSPAPTGIEVHFEEADEAVAARPMQSVIAPMPPQALSEDIDPEILEIFIEESEEELSNINEFLPSWLNDEGNHDALGGMRRSFHTLKGSGRLVGAMRIGEFAWAFENVLNRIIDGTIPRSDVVCGLLERAACALPELIAQIRDGSSTTEPAEALAELAQACSRGEAVSLDSLATPAAVEVETESAKSASQDGSPVVLDQPLAEETSGQVPGVDPVLYEIFSNESRDHVGTVQAFLEYCRTAGYECHVSDALLRALHTLHGSARMAGAEAIADVANAIERYAKALHRGDRPLSAEGTDLLRQAMAIIESLVAQFQYDGISPTDHAAVIQQLEELSHRAAEHDPGIVPANEALPGADAGGGAEEPSAVKELGVETQELQSFDIGAVDVDLDTVGSEEIESQRLAFDTVIDSDLSRVASSTTASDLEDPFSTSFFEPIPVADPSEPGRSPAADFAAPAVEPSVASDIDMLPDSRADASDVSVPYSASTGLSDNEGSDVGYDTADQDLIEVFLEEGEEILAASDAALHKWIEAPGDHPLMAELQRHLHTLKGGARMAGISAIGNLSHSLESLLIAVVDGLVAPSTSLFDVLLIAQDHLVHMLEAVRDRKPLQEATDVISQLEMLRRGEAPVSAHVRPDHAVAAGAPAITAENGIQLPSTGMVSAAAPQSVVTEPVADEQLSAARSQQELVRVRADLLDNMVNFAGEISIYRSRLEQQIGSMRFNLSELGQTVERIRDQLRKLEIETEAQVLFRYERDAATADEHFDPLEMDRYSHLQQLSRSMLESISDLGSIQGLMDNITRESETLLLQQSRVNTELQEGLMRTRMVPFSGLAPRMRRILRQAAQELGKRAELVLEGAGGEMDRTVIDRIIAPIEHMLRNAVAHGIESPEQRTAAGKKPAGTIKVSLSRDGSEVVIRLADDGAGMNIAAIRRKARERGLIAEDADISDSDVMQFVLETGFSTAERVSQIAGRGIGMDVVNSEVKQLGGSLHIDSKQGVGTTFTIRLPFTLAISQALLVQVHEEVYAIPLTGIEGIVRMRGDELSRYLNDAGAHFEYAGFSYPVRNLGEMLGHGAPVTAGATPKRLPVLLVRSGDHRMALQVEGLLGSRETVVKSVGPQISSIRGISGATILGDGRVVLILDLGGLLRSGGVAAVIDRVLAEAARPEERQLLVMVVDDSITVRKVTTRLLERNGMQVVTAKDGVDAVAKLQENLPDVMLLDIEMPRMDGFELATHVRNEARLSAIPMIMITSRTGDKHRRRAMEIGVDRYLGKPFQEGELLETINTLAEERHANG